MGHPAMNVSTVQQPETSEHSSEEELLEEGIRKIVISRERTPRSPQWSRAWWRTLVRYSARLTELRRHAPAGQPAEHLKDREESA